MEHSEECYEAGELYLAGEGVPQSDAEALKWYRRGAAMENVLSAWRIGQFYEEGRGGLKQSYEEALKWYHSALGELKYISWDSIYGLIYGHDDKEEYGFAYPMVSDDRTVAEWYRARADAGDANAQWLTGVRYHLGRGLEYSEEKALACFRRSAEQKNVVGMTFLGVGPINKELGSPVPVVWQESGTHWPVSSRLSMWTRTSPTRSTTISLSMDLPLPKVLWSEPSRLEPIIVSRAYCARKLPLG